MTSFLSRMANEATAALSDAYGHVMHGDDAGSSARLVWVVHPTKVPIDLNLGGDGTTAGGINSSVGNGTGKKSSSGKKKLKDDSSPGSPGRNGSSSVPSSYFFTQKFGKLSRMFV